MVTQACVHRYGFPFLSPHLHPLPSNLENFSSLLCPQTVFTSGTKWETKAVGTKEMILVWGKKISGGFPGNFAQVTETQALCLLPWTARVDFGHSEHISREENMVSGYVTPNWDSVYSSPTERFFCWKSFLYWKLMTPFTWDSHAVTPTQSLRKPNTGSSFFRLVIFFIEPGCDKGWFIFCLFLSWLIHGLRASLD